MSRPKVILIGGCPGAGKTTLGRALAARLGYASLTIDDLLHAARALTTPDSHPGLHVMNKPNCTVYFTDSPLEKLVADATLQHEALWPAVERTIRNHASWGQPIVVDGWHLRPEWTRALDLEQVSAHWLVVDPGVLEARERNNADFFSTSRDPDQMMKRFLARSLWSNELIERQARSTGDQILRQDGTRSVVELCTDVESRLGMRSAEPRSLPGRD
jgi:2-phosphoglycerate kinase